MRRFLLTILCAVLCSAVFPALAETISTGRLGTVPYAVPQGRPADIVVLFADPAAKPTADAVARLTALHAAVATVDPAPYLKTLASQGGECAWLSSDIEEVNRSLLRKLGFTSFRLPVLASIGADGGALVYGLLAEAPSYSFGGGASVGFTPMLGSPVTICGIGAVEDKQKRWLPAVDVKMPWHVQPAAADAEAVGDWLDDVDKAELVPFDGAKLAAATLAELAAPLIESAVSDEGSIHDLPVIEMPVDTAAGGKPAPYLAIVYSGDGGWRDLDRTLGQVLSDKEVPVVGLDSLLYFWQPKRPEVVAHDLDRIMDHYRSEWENRPFRAYRVFLRRGHPAVCLRPAVGGEQGARGGDIAARPLARYAV